MRSLSTLLGLALVGVATAAVHHTKAKAKHFAGSVQFKHRLRVCNAYPYADALDVFRGREKLTKLPLEYKMCGDFSSQLLAGDKLKFMVGDASAGTFTISDLPNNDAVLLLVIHRHDTLSTAVAFKSHVFANLLNAQVAVIDTFKGRARGFAEITDGSKREEKLRYNSVVAVNPGEYKVSLLDTGKKASVVEKLVALNRESYVIIRTGVEAEQGPQYPQDLIVYPMSDPALLHSASPHTSLPAAALLASLLAMCTMRL
jgi:hypothetical protein